MIKKSLIFSLFVVAFAFAGEEASHSSELFWETVNTIILLGIIAFFGGKYIKKALNDRREAVISMVEEAKKAREDSIKAIKEAEEKLKEAQYKLEEGKRIAQERAKMEREHAIAQANEIAERIKKQAKETINIEIKKAESYLKKYATEKAIEIANKIIAENMNDNLNKAVVKNSIKKLKEGGA
ncbi:hypothetical protein JCM14244_00680 [Venenivibrio stagnispumantis]|uniref:ATP synthase subunit b n=1 Tax=Venenivibrio stagnispumantis TaxID=407998 RepID=A0AA45WK77_9AQUI|nr:ATP synthase F0 subunit B [Venenivibrio stagnispumantis]MCW4573950.1 ATP synthase F0 subunit B [Venenivibrio stagnispumantis]SMP05914.1 F-type H+-transporting ATPase subunit b [Venenivibrio stagnispumantis]